MQRKKDKLETYTMYTLPVYSQFSQYNYKIQLFCAAVMSTSTRASFSEGMGAKYLDGARKTAYLI